MEVYCRYIFLRHSVIIGHFVGAIYVDSYAAAVVESSVFYLNAADFSIDSQYRTYGGAIFYNGQRQLDEFYLQVESSVFESNEATYGSALVLHGRDVTVSNSTFDSNIATEGALYIVDAEDVSLEQNSFSSNSFVSVYVSSSYRVDVISCDVSTSEGMMGSAMLVTDSEDIRTIDSKFVDNNSTSGFGGALYISTSRDIGVDSCIFDSNIAYDSGGSIFVSQCSDVTFRKNAFNSSVAQVGSGGGVYLTATSNVNFYQNSFLENTASFGGGAGVYWDAGEMDEPSGIATNSYADCSALYGKNYATDIVALKYNSTGPPYYDFITEFETEKDYTFFFTDYYDNIVKNQDTFVTAGIDSLQSECGSEESYITGKTVSQSSSGIIFRFNLILLVCDD